MVNAIWGSANLILGIAAATGADRSAVGLIVAAAGFLALAVFCAHHFGEVRASR